MNKHSLDFYYNDGGRSKYYKGGAGDCVVRAIAIATQRDYKKIYNTLRDYIGHTPRNGVSSYVVKNFIVDVLGFEYVAITRCSPFPILLHRNIVPDKGIYILDMDKHLMTVANYTVFDTGTVLPNYEVYGYYIVMKE